MKNEILIGDTIEVMEKMPNESIDLVITSPPYNLGMEYGYGIDDCMPWKKYYEWCWLWMEEVYYLLKPNRRFCINHYLSCGDAKRGRTAPLMELNRIAQEIGFKHHGIAIWNEPTVSKLTAWGSYMRASAPWVNSPYEGILILYKGDWKREDEGESTISKEDFIEGVSGVWKMQSQRRTNHPAPYPLRLPQLCIDLFSYKGDTILDNFSGSATTNVACALANRNCIGIEKNPEFAKEGQLRINNAIIQKEMNGG